MSSIGHNPGQDPPPAPRADRGYDESEDAFGHQEGRRGLPTSTRPGSRQRGLHPAVPTVLALISIWLWAFRPPVLTPESPSIPLAYQEAGLRMEMFIRVNEIQRFLSENGRLPEQLSEVGDSPEGMQYVPATGGTFTLSGRSRDITVYYNSTQSLSNLLADAKLIVSGGASST